VTVAAVSGFIRERRLLQGWTQAELAQHLGVSRQAFNAIEAGRAQPSVETALALARLLGCTVERLLAPDTPQGSAIPLPRCLPGRASGSPRSTDGSIRIVWTRRAGRQPTRCR
jgi:putative transcriptional regulator